MRVNQMKKIINVCFFFILNIFVLNAQVEWGDPKIVCEGAHPDFAIDRETGNLHIIVLSTNLGVVYVLADSAGNILNTPDEKVPGSEGDYSYYPIGSASIAVDHNGYPHVCFANRLRKHRDDYYYYDVVYTMKNDNGWTEPVKLAEGVFKGYLVRIAVDGNGRAHIVRCVTTDATEPYATVTYYRINNGVLDFTQENLQPYRIDNSMEIDASEGGIAHLVLGSPDPQGTISYFRTKTKEKKFALVNKLQTLYNKGRTGSPDVFLDPSGNVHFCYGTLTDVDLNMKPSVRYVRYEGSNQTVNVPVTYEGELDTWKNGNGWGLGSVAATDDGQYVAVAYVVKDVGQLLVMLSSDGGSTWFDGKAIDNLAGGYDSRSKHVIRANGNDFYILYRTRNIHNIILNDTIKICRFRFGDFPPVCNAGGPYTGEEGSPVLLDGSGSIDNGFNSGFDKYEWDFENDGIYDFENSTPQVAHIYTDDFSGEVGLRVTDLIGQTDSNVTTIQISNIPPEIDAGDDIDCSEGDILTFSCSVSDPGNDTHQYQWNLGDGILGDQATIQHTYLDEGNFRVTVNVSDDDNGTDKDTVDVTVTNVPPEVDIGGPYRGSKVNPVSFSGNAIDPGKNDVLSFVWDLDGDGQFESTGQHVIKLYDEDGTYTVYLKVTDDDGGIGIDSTNVHISTIAPVITQISDQTIDEGGTFSQILLDNYVTDTDDSDSDLVWNYYGNMELIVTLNNRILTVTPPDIEWSGHETITLVVTDPSHLVDSAEVKFSVNPVNDPPKWTTEIPEFTFKEDDTLTISFSFLRTFVTDIDDQSEDLQFSVTGSDIIFGMVDSIAGILYLYAKADWYGSTQVLFVVSDLAGASAEKSCSIKITSAPDPPSPFSLISPIYLKKEEWPDTLIFKWEKTSNPDSDNFVFYEWILNNQKSGFQYYEISKFIVDTTYQFIPDEDLQHGIYFWFVKAYNKSDSSRKSEKVGIINIGTPDGIDIIENVLPHQFQLLQNYPNPFNPCTEISYHLPKQCWIRLIVYNSLGQELEVLDEGYKNGGIYTVTWYGRDQFGEKVPSGIYFYRLEADSRLFFRKMIMIQ
jgi:hypothetical protein